ncbi:MAG: acyl-ACP--UDP-N-acetylglucosamine O-acyltransferase [Planctomycetes bacterium]|nr:acyl-ACP--UDP-N-acetylglucosamine O-acyltransferase [Planctomycetota bacterium]
MSKISEFAVIDKSAKIGSDVTIGPFCVIGPDVTIQDGCELMNNVTVQGVTVIGRSNVFYPNAVIGVAPQDLKYNGAPTQTIIGNDNVVRENCTIHRGTELGGGKTVMGNNNLIMAGAHIAHDCILDDHILLSNQVMLAGHVRIERGAVVSALAGVHHFVSIGLHSYVAAMTPVRRDVPPFVKVAGDPPEVRGLNNEGLSRNGYSRQDIDQLKQAYKKLFRNSSQTGNIVTQLDELEADDSLNKHVRYLCQFVRRSCQSRFNRALEASRGDRPEDRCQKDPAEIREKHKLSG